MIIRIIVFAIVVIGIGGAVTSLYLKYKSNPGKPFPENIQSYGDVVTTMEKIPAPMRG